MLEKATLLGESGGFISQSSLRSAVSFLDWLPRRFKFNLDSEPR